MYLFACCWDGGHESQHQWSWNCTTPVYCQSCCMVQNVGRSPKWMDTDSMHWTSGPYRNCWASNGTSSFLMLKCGRPLLTSTIQARHISLFGHIAWLEDNADPDCISTRRLEETILTSSDHIDEDSPKCPWVPQKWFIIACSGVCWLWVALALLVVQARNDWWDGLWSRPLTVNRGNQKEYQTVVFDLLQNHPN